MKLFFFFNLDFPFFFFFFVPFKIIFLADFLSGLYYIKLQVQEMGLFSYCIS